MSSEQMWVPVAGLRPVMSWTRGDMRSAWGQRITVGQLEVPWWVRLPGEQPHGHLTKESAWDEIRRAMARPDGRGIDGEWTQSGPGSVHGPA